MPCPHDDPTRIGAKLFCGDCGKFISDDEDDSTAGDNPVEESGEAAFIHGQGGSAPERIAIVDPDIEVEDEPEPVKPPRGTAGNPTHLCMGGGVADGSQSTCDVCNPVAPLVHGHVCPDGESRAGVWQDCDQCNPSTVEVQKPKRKRRTKAEIEAEKRLEEAKAREAEAVAKVEADIERVQGNPPTADEAHAAWVAEAKAKAREDARQHTNTIKSVTVTEVMDDIRAERDNRINARGVKNTAVEGKALIRYDLIPAGPLEQLATLYGAGAVKYSPRNWELGFDWSTPYNAAIRHMQKHNAGEDIDPETNVPHVIAAAWNMFAIAEFMTTHPELDDRRQ